MTTPSLHEQLTANPSELRSLIHFIARRVIDEEEAEALTDEVERWVGKHLGRDYPWPGNFRELEQCVKNVLIRHEYRPPVSRPVAAPRERLADDLDRRPADRRRIAAALLHAGLLADPQLRRNRPAAEPGPPDGEGEGGGERGGGRWMTRRSGLTPAHLAAAHDEPAARWPRARLSQSCRG